jgi:2-haloacid dehalogenase
MTIPIHAIIFDFGGVLVNWDPHQVFLKYFSNDIQAIDHFLTEINFPAWNLEQDRGHPFKQAVAELSAQFPQYAHLIRAYDVEWEESITGDIPGTVELLHRLKAAGYALYGLTNWNLGKYSIVRHKYAFFDLFDDIIVSGEVKLAKPDPAIFQLLLQKINRLPQDCLLIDDSPKNIEAAREMGFVSVLFTTPENLETELFRLNVFPQSVIKYT